MGDGEIKSTTSIRDVTFMCSTGTESLWCCLVRRTDGLATCFDDIAVTGLDKINAKGSIASVSDLGTMGVSMVRLPTKNPFSVVCKVVRDLLSFRDLCDVFSLDILTSDSSSKLARCCILWCTGTGRGDDGASELIVIYSITFEADDLSTGMHEFKTGVKPEPTLLALVITVEVGTSNEADKRDTDEAETTVDVDSGAINAVACGRFDRGTDGIAAPDRSRETTGKSEDGKATQNRCKSDN